MTIASVGTIGTGTGATNEATSVITVATNALAAGDFALVAFASDNALTADGDEGMVSGVVDNASGGSNVWHKAAEFCNGQGAAQAGCTISLWYCNVERTLAIGGTITATLTNATLRDSTAHSGWKFSKAAGYDVVPVAINQLASDNVTAFGSLDATTANLPHLRVRASALEYGTTTPAITKTAGWGSIFAETQIGTTAAGAAVKAEFIISTATGAASLPTWSMATAIDMASVYVAFAERKGKQFRPLATAAPTPNFFGQLQDGGAAVTVATTTYGWVPGTTALTNPYYRSRLGASAGATAASAASLIGATSGPTKGTGATNTTAGDSYISPAAYTAAIPAGNWLFNFHLICTTITTTGKLRMRVWASVNADGTSARELTSGAVESNITTLDTIGIAEYAIITWAAPAIVLANEYLFFQLEWQETTVGSAAGCNALFYVGDAVIVTPDWYQTASATLAGAGRLVAGVIPVALLLHCNGTDASTSFPDSGDTNHTVTVHGNVQVSTASSKFGGASAKFTGVDGDYLSLDGSSDFAFGTGDYTIDFWVTVNSLNNPSLYDGRAFGVPVATIPNIYLNGNTINVYFNGLTVISSASLTWNAGQAYHIALTRSGSNTRLFRDGTQVGSTFVDSSSIGANTNRPVFGINGENPTSSLNGYIDEIRVIKGYAAWTSNFTPLDIQYGSKVSLLLHCNGANASTSFPDASGLGHVVTAHGNAQVSTTSPKFGSGSASFTGANGDYLTVDGGSDFAFPGEFTIDFWVTVNAAITTFTTLFDGTNLVAADVIGIYIHPDNSLRLQFSGGDRITSSVLTWTIGQAYHIAVTRDSLLNHRLFRDGVQLGPTTFGNANYLSYADRPTIGAAGGSPPGTFALNGYIDEVRIIKDYAFWTANFTPPSSPYVGVGGESIDGTASFAGVGALAAASAQRNAATALLAGAGSLTAAVVHPGPTSAVFAGTGALAAAAVHPLAATTSFAAVGGFAATGVHLPDGVAVLAAVGSLGANGVRSFAVGAAGLAAVGSLIADGTVQTQAGTTWTDTAVLAAVGGLSAAADHPGPDTAALAAVGGLFADGDQQFAGAVALAGVGGLVGSGVHLSTAASVLVGAGGLFADGDQQFVAVAALAGVGGLVGSGVHPPVGAVVLAGAGGLSAAGVQQFAGIVTFAGAGGLSAVGVQQLAGVVTFAGAGSLSAAGDHPLAGTAALGGVGALVANGTIVGAVTNWSGQATLAGVGGLVGIGVHPLISAAVLAGTGGLFADGVHPLIGTAALAGAGALVADVAHPLAGAAVLAGIGGLVGTGVHPPVGTAALAGAGSLSGTGVHPVAGDAVFAGVGGLSAAGDHPLAGGSSFAGVGTLVAAGVHPLAAASVLAGVGALAGEGVIAGAVNNWSGQATLAGAGNLVAVSIQRLSASAGFAGVGALTAPSRQTTSAVAALAGIGSLDASVQGLESAAAALAGAGSFAAAGVHTPAATAILAAVGGLVAPARESKAASASFAAVGGFSGNGLVAGAVYVWPAAATLDGSGNLFALATRVTFVLPATATLVGSGSLSALANRLAFALPATAALAGSGGLSALAARPPSDGIVAFAGAGGLVALGRVKAAGVVDFGAVGSFAAAATARFTGRAALAAVGDLEAVGSKVWLASADLEGVGYLAALTSILAQNNIIEGGDIVHGTGAGIRTVDFIGQSIVADFIGQSDMLDFIGGNFVADFTGSQDDLSDQRTTNKWNARANLVGVGDLEAA